MIASPKFRSSALACCAQLAIAALMLLQPELALAQFQKGTTALQKFYDWLWLIVPIGAAIIGIGIGLFYSADMIRKDTAIQWGLGVVFAGAIVGGFIKLLF